MADQGVPSTSSLRGLDWLNFFLADIQTGVGPFLAVYLASHHWNDARVGIALSVAGLTGVVCQTPAGALVDRVHRKRLLIMAAALLMVLGAMLLAFFPNFPAVIGAQVLLGAVGTVFLPTVNAITLGLVGHQLLDRRIGRNQTFNSAGNVFAAVVMGVLGYMISTRSIFFAVAGLAIPTITALRFIDPKQIDYDRARGATDDGKTPQVTGLRAVFEDHCLLVFVGCAVLFHFANAAMLPQLGEMLAKGKGRQSALFMSACIITTQLVISLTAAWVGRKASEWGRKPLVLIGFGVLPIRGVLYTLTSATPLLIGIQVLDGVANSIFGVVSVLVVADLTRGTGRFNITQGALTTAVGIGASLSTTVAGFLAVRFGYHVSFLYLAGIAALAVLLLWSALPETKDRQVQPAGGKQRRPVLV